MKRVGPKRLFCHNDISCDEDISHSMCENKNIIIKKRLKVLFLCNRKSKNKNKNKKEREAWPFGASISERLKKRQSVR